MTRVGGTRVVLLLVAATTLGCQRREIRRDSNPRIAVRFARGGGGVFCFMARNGSTVVMKGRTDQAAAIALNAQNIADIDCSRGPLSFQAILAAATIDGQLLRMVLDLRPPSVAITATATTALGPAALEGKEDSLRVATPSLVETSSAAILADVGGNLWLWISGDRQPILVASSVESASVWSRSLFYASSGSLVRRSWPELTPAGGFRSEPHSEIVAVSENRVVTVSPGRIGSVRFGDSKHAWSAPSSGLAVRHAIVGDYVAVMAVEGDSSVEVREMEHGHLIWRRRASYCPWMASAPQNLILCERLPDSRGCELVSRRPRDGGVLWHGPDLGDCPLAHAFNGDVVAISVGQNVLGVQHDSGKIVWEIDVARALVLGAAPLPPRQIANCKFANENSSRAPL